MKPQDDPRTLSDVFPPDEVNEFELMFPDRLITLQFSPRQFGEALRAELNPELNEAQALEFAQAIMCCIRWPAANGNVVPGKEVQDLAIKRFSVNSAPMNPVDRLRMKSIQHNVEPTGIVIAADAPYAIGEALVIGDWTFAVTEVLTEAEFKKRRAANVERRTRQEREMGMEPTTGYFLADCRGNRLNAATSTDTVPEPDASMKYFYALKPVTRKPRP